MDKNLKKLIKEYEDRGWYLERKKKHYIYKHPDGGVVSVSSTVSDVNMRWGVRKDFKNEERKMRERKCKEN